jgi:hypothetical protein
MFYVMPFWSTDILHERTGRGIKNEFGPSKNKTRPVTNTLHFRVTGLKDTLRLKTINNV